MSNQSAYRSIMKGTAIFGGVQVFQILLGLIRGKLVALFLGAAGMGVASLLTATCSMIQQFASLGLNMVAVRDISVSNASNDLEKSSSIVKAVLRAIRLTGIVGALFTAAFAKGLSIATFGNENYYWHFVALSVSVFFALMSNGENAVLQGFRRLKSLAARNLAGGIIGLVVGVPLYYWKGEEGIVPSMIISGFILYLFSWYGRKKITLLPLSQTWKETSTICRSIIVLGLLMTFASCLGMVANYLILGFINSHGSIANVGFYNAANSITMQYCGMVFSAMGTDYYPRLSGLVNDRKATIELVSQQTELIILIIVPLSMVIFFLAPIIIRVLLTEEFLPVIDLVRYMALGLIFKAFCFPMGYLAMAKGDRIYYFLTEGIWTNIKTPLIFIAGYYYFGLIGLGYAAVLNSLVDVLVVSVLTNWRYKIHLNRSFYLFCIPLLITEIICFCCSFVDNPYWSYGSMALITTIAFFFAYKELDKRIGISSIIRTRLLKRKN